MDPTTQTPDREHLRMNVTVYRQWAESAAEAAHQHAAGALNAASTPHAHRHSAAATAEARRAHELARQAEATAEQLPDLMTAQLQARDTAAAAQRASVSAGLADQYATWHPSHRESAQARADLELIQATAAFIQARRHRQQLGALTYIHNDDDAPAIAYATAQERERNARARMEAAQRETETDPDSLTADRTDDNPDAPDARA